MFRRKKESISIVRFFKYIHFTCASKKKNKKKNETSFFCVVNMQYIIKKFRVSDAD